MDIYNEIYDGFMRAFRYYVEKEGYGGRSFLAAKVGISTAMMSKILHKTNPKPISKNLQAKLANACGYELEAFIEFGRKLLSENEKETRSFELVQPDEKNETLPEIDPITREHMELIKKFRHKEQAKKINEHLLTIDKQYSDNLKEVEWILQGMAAGLKFKFEVVNNSQSSNTEGKLKNGTED